jgi:hypothetical protein
MANTPGLPSLETPEEETKQPGFLANAPKSKGLSPSGQIAMDPKQTAELLANMQDMVDQRTGAFNTFMSGLKDASAWGSGGERGPSAALALREEAKNKEFKDVYDMRTQMAAYRAAQAQQEAYNKEQASIFGPAGAMGGGGGGSGAGKPTAGVPYKGIMLDPEIAVAMAQARSREDRDKIFNDFVSKRSQAIGSFNYGAPSYKTDIKWVNPETKELELIDAITAKRYKDQGYGQVIGPATPQEYRPTAAGGVSPEAIKQVESGGRPGLVSSAGAEGTMQVMPNTQTNPGYGVTPAKDKSQAELERVGRDYYAAMQKQYGNDTMASIAYNMGPGRTDEWLKKGGNFRDLPAETRDYIGQVHLATAKLNRAAAEVAPTQSGASRKTPTIPQAEIALEGEKARAVSAGTAAGKYIGGSEATLREASSTSGERLASLQYLENLVNNPKTSRVFGVFQKPDFVSSVGAIIDKGIKLGRLGDVGVDLEPLVRANMKGATQEEIDAAQQATREFAKIKLNEAKVALAGQGAVSDAERGLITELSGSIKNSPGALRDYLAWGKMRAEYDRDVGNAFKKFSGNYEQFLKSDIANSIREDYNDKLYAFAAKKSISMNDMEKKGSQLDSNQSKPSKPSSLVYSDPDKEKRYQLYKQQNPGTK